MANLTREALQEAGKLPDLLIEATKVAQTLEQGVHGRRRVGIGESFWQYRYYEGGDSISLIDWKQSARGERLYVRQREWEAAQTVYLWIDRSGSMHYRSQASLPSKSERAHVLMLALANLLLFGGEFVTWLGDEPLQGRGQAGFEKIAARVLPIRENKLELPLELPLRKNAHMLICSDFLSDMALWRDRLRGYGAQNIKGILVHISDPEEENPGFKGRVRLNGMKGEPSLLLPQAEAIRAVYLQNLALHKQRVRTMAESIGWHSLTHVTNSSASNTLLQIYNMLTLGDRAY